MNAVINILASATLFELMVAIGLGVSISDVVRVGRDVGLIARAALASYVCVPAAAIALLILFQADPMVAVGFLIIAVCPGAPYGPPFTALARGDVAAAVGLMVMLAGSSALLAPLLLAALLPVVMPHLPPLPEEAEALAVDAGKIAMTLLLAQFLPLAIGMAVRHRWPKLADRLKKPADRLSLILNLALFALILWAQWDMIRDVSLQGYFGMLLLVTASIAAGAALGGRDQKIAMVMATSVRNVGVCLVIVTAAFPGTRAVVAVTAFALVQTILMALIALAWGRWAARSDGAPAKQPATTAAE